MSVAGEPVDPTPFGPGGWPFAGWRPWIALAGAVVALLIVPIMLAEGAPGLARDVAGWVRTSDNALARVADSLRLPRSAFEIHVVAWAAAGVVAGLVSWSWRSFALFGLSAVVASMALEVAQDVVTATRSTELSDAIGNAVGLTFGLGMAAVANLVWRRAARFRGRRDQGRDQGGDLE